MGTYWSWHLAVVVDLSGRVPVGLDEVERDEDDDQQRWAGRILWSHSEDHPGADGLSGAFSVALLQHHVHEVTRLAGRPARVVWFQNKG